MLWFKSDIDNEMEILCKSGAIEIEEVVYDTDTAEQKAARMTELNTLAKERAQWTFFKPGLNPGAVLATDRGTLQACDSTTDLSKITAGLTGTSAAALTGVGASEDAGPPRRPGAAVATGAMEVDLNAAFFNTIEGTITTTADLAALGVASASVKLRYGVKDDGQRWKDHDEAVLRAPGDAKAYRFFIDRLGTRELEYQVVLANRPDFAIGHDASTEESPWIPTTTRNLDINPLMFSSVLRVHVEAAMVDWATVKQIQARIRYEDPRAGISAADTRILTRESPLARIPIRPKDPRVRGVSVEATFFYNDGASEAVTLSHDGGEPFIIYQPPDSTTVVDVTLADALERYRKISVQFGRPGTTPPEVRHTVTVGPGSAAHQWSFRRAQPKDVRYSYRVTSFLKDGAVREGDWTTTDNPLLVVGDRAAGILTVKVMMLGTPAEGGFLMAKLELDYPDAPPWADSHVETLFQANTTEFDWRVPMARPEATSYTYKVTWFRSDGQRVASGPNTTSDEILLLDPLSP